MILPFLLAITYLSIFSSSKEKNPKVQINNIVKDMPSKECEEILQESMPSYVYAQKLTQKLYIR